MAQTRTQLELIKFLVAHVSFIGFPVSVTVQRTALQRTSISPSVLWLLRLRRLDVTVGHANVRTCVTLCSVCSRTCQVTTCISFSFQLNHELCKPAVNLMFSLAVYATRSPSCSLDQFCLETDHVFCCGPSGPACAFVHLRLIVDTRSQLRSCHDRRLSVSNPKVCKPALNHRLHPHCFHPEHVASAFTHDSKHTLQHVLHDKILNSVNFLDLFCQSFPMHGPEWNNRCSTAMSPFTARVPEILANLEFTLALVGMLCGLARLIPSLSQDTYWKSAHCDDRQASRNHHTYCQTCR